MHTVLEIIGWSIVAAVSVWGITLYWAKLALAKSRAAMREEVRYWHAEATRARELSAQLKHEIATWSRGCQQGRADVLAVMPLLVAAQEQLSGAKLADLTEV
jgi:hypothetical protein